MKKTPDQEMAYAAQVEAELNKRLAVARARARQKALKDLEAKQRSAAKGLYTTTKTNRSVARTKTRGRHVAA